MDHPPQKNANADIAVLYVIHVYSHPMIAATSPSSPRRVFDLTGSDASTRLHDFGVAGAARSTSLPPSHDFGVASRADSLAATDNGMDLFIRPHAGGLHRKGYFLFVYGNRVAVTFPALAWTRLPFLPS